MLCPNCSKLAIIAANKKCLRCQGLILNNLSCICDNCSSNELMCSICLKKMAPNNTRKQTKFGCGCKK